MSGNTETLEQEENVVEGLLDQSVEAGADTEADLPNEATETEAPEIDLSTLVDSRSDEERQHNKQNAEQRILRKRTRELEDKLKQLESQPYQADTSELKKPRRTDFLNDKVLYDQYGGNEQLALAAFEDAKDDYNDSVRNLSSKAEQEHKGHSEQARFHLQIEEGFDEHAKDVRHRIPNFDTLIDKAESILGVEGALLIKDQYGENAPLMLAALGHDRNLTASLTQGSQVEAFRKLAALEHKVVNSRSSLNTQSTASTETAVKSNELSGVASIEAAMKKAADKGDHKQYIELRKQLDRVQRG